MGDVRRMSLVHSNGRELKCGILSLLTKKGRIRLLTGNKFELIQLYWRLLLHDSHLYLLGYENLHRKGLKLIRMIPIVGCPDLAPPAAALGTVGVAAGELAASEDQFFCIEAGDKQTFFLRAFNRKLRDKWAALINIHSAGEFEDMHKTDRNRNYMLPADGSLEPACKDREDECLTIPLGKDETFTKPGNREIQCKMSSAELIDGMTVSGDGLTRESCQRATSLSPTAGWPWSSADDLHREHKADRQSFHSFGTTQIADTTGSLRAMEGLTTSEPSILNSCMSSDTDTSFEDTDGYVIMRGNAHVWPEDMDGYVVMRPNEGRLRRSRTVSSCIYESFMPSSYDFVRDCDNMSITA